MSVKQLIDKWEAMQEELKPYTKASDGRLPLASIMAHQVRQQCINDLKEYQKEQLTNGSINH